MTSDTDKAASKAKAARLRQQIARLSGAAPEPPAAPPAKGPLSPREFIAQRMRALAGKKK